MKQMLVTKNKTQFVFKITASCLFLLLAVFLFVPIHSVEANSDLESEITESTDVVADEAGLENQNVRIIIGRIIKIFLGFVGTIALIIVIYAGYLYMTSGGDPGKVETAKKWMTNGAIGLVIIFSAYAITSYILNALLGQDDGGGEYTIATAVPKGLGYGLTGSAFGEILSGVSPYPEQTDVPRNTMVLVTFKLPISPESVINESGDYSQCPASITQCTDGDCPADESVCGPVDTSNFKLYRCADMVDWPSERALDKCFDLEIKDPNAGTEVPGYIIVTADRKTIIFNPNADTATHLGSADSDVSYIVELAGGPSGIKKLEPSFESVFGQEGHKWRFTTGTFIDSTPPQVKSVIPVDQAGIDTDVEDITLDDDGEVKRNTLVLVNFNEPVIPPLSASQAMPCLTGYNNNEAQLLMNSGTTGGCTTGHVPGEWLVGINQYRTIQFVPSAACEGVDINSCGLPVFCLPEDALLDGKVLAAEIVEGIAQIGTGIMDLASNSLDGNADGTADGPVDDNYGWSFRVGDTVDLVPPAITELIPKNAEGNIDTKDPIKAIFDKPLEPATVDTEIYLYGEDYTGWFDPNLVIDDSMNTVSLSHAPFYAPPQIEGESVQGPMYMPVIRSQVRDLFQNCFTPSRSTGDQAQTTTVTGNCTTIGSGEANYGDSCCPAATDYQPTHITAEQAAAAGNDYNECSVGNITRE